MILIAYGILMQVPILTFAYMYTNSFFRTWDQDEGIARYQTPFSCFIELFIRPLVLLCFGEKEKPVLCQLLFCYRTSDRNFKLCNVHDLPVTLKRRIFEPDFLSLLQWIWFKKGYFMFHFRHPVLVLHVLSV